MVNDTRYENISGWHIYHYASGKVEAYYISGSRDVALTALKSGGVYTHDEYVNKSFALPAGVFTSVHYANINAGSTGYTQSQVAATSTTQITIRVWSSYSTTVNGMRIYLHVVGRWK